MYEGKGKPPLLFYLAASLVAAFWVGFCDGLALWMNGILSLEELFLLGTGELGVSIMAYTVLLAFGISVLISAAGYLTLRSFPNLLGKKSGISHLVVCVVASSLSLLALRFLIMKKEPEFGQFLFVYLLVVFGSLFILGVNSARYESRVRYAAMLGRSPVAFLLMLVLLAVVFLPHIQSQYLKWRFSAKRGEVKRPNIVFIVMDTTRADALSCYNSEKATTPHIDAIAAEGTRFTRAISASQWTAPSHASMFTGLYPSQHGTNWDYALLEEEFLTLAECLSGSGYRTAGFSENPFVSQRRGMTQGFETFYEMYRFRRLAAFSRLIDKGRKIFSDFMPTQEFARETARCFRRWILKNAGGKKSRPFFAFLNFMPAHLPNYHREAFEFVNPDKKEMSRIEPINTYPERHYLPQYKLNSSELKTMRLLYEGDIAYMDSVLGGIFAFLRKSGILDDTVLVITSDHGENFGDHGYIEHFFSLHNTLIHVPLIIRFPWKFEPGTVRKDVVSTAFLFRTILDLAGEPRTEPPYPFDNRSLLDSLPGGLVCAEHDNGGHMIRSVIQDEAPEGFDFSPFDKYMKCVYHDGMKFIWSSTGNHMLFDMTEDWQERENLYEEERKTAAVYQELLREWHEGLWRPASRWKKKRIDKDEEALRSLGYIK